MRWRFGVVVVVLVAGLVLAVARGGGGPGPAAAGDGAVAAVADLRLDRRVVMSGHSLTDPLQAPLQAMVRLAGGPVGVIERSTIPGSPMDWRWDHQAEPVDARARIADFDVLVITERVPLSNTRPWHASEDWALRWARHAWAEGADGAGAEVLLYASWVAIGADPWAGDSDPDAALPWRERMDREDEGWRAILAHVNANRPEGAAPMRMIPANRVLAAVHDAIEAGRAPEGLPGIETLFSDTIHPGALGAELVAMTHFAVLYGRDPAGLRAPPQVDQALWAWMAELVAEVVSAEPATGVDLR